MLEGLDEIDWGSLTHAYGAADDVPDLLRAWASNDLATVKEAEAALFGNIHHQGTVYEATEFAVPFLIELLRRPQTLERLGLIVLLASIAEGKSFEEVHSPYAAFVAAAREKLARELEWKQRARAAVQAGADDFWSLLNDPTVRVAIPYLLSKLPEEAETVCARAPRLFGSTREELFEASVLFMWVSSLGTGEEADFHRILQEESIPLFRLGGALGVLRIGVNRQNVDEALKIYFDALQRTDTYEPKDENWVWGLGDLTSLLLEWVEHFHSTANEALRRGLPSALPGMRDYAAQWLAYSAIHLGFDPNHLPPSKSQLNPLQLALLEALTRSLNVMYQKPLIVEIQRALGLPNDMKRLKEFLLAP